MYVILQLIYFTVFSSRFQSQQTLVSSGNAMTLLLRRMPLLTTNSEAEYLDGAFHFHNGNYTTVVKTFWFWIIYRASHKNISNLREMVVWVNREKIKNNTIIKNIRLPENHYLFLFHKLIVILETFQLIFI